MLKEIISTFIVMFAVIDIMGSVPIIIGIREKKKTYNPLVAAVISFVILAAFLFVGQAMLGLFGVDVSSFAVAGALVLLVLAIEMIFGIQIFKDDGAYRFGNYCAHSFSAYSRGGFVYDAIVAKGRV